MTTFTVWKFDDPDGADRTVEILQNAQADRIIKIDDHAVVRWPVGQSHPDTSHGHDSNWRGVGWGAVLGLMIGALFFLPVVGGLAGAALDLDRLGERMHGMHKTLIATNLTEAERSELLETFGGR
jgi:uncharacterized membrane protein